jgi:endonuclease G
VRKSKVFRDVALLLVATLLLFNVGCQPNTSSSINALAAQSKSDLSQNEHLKYGIPSANGKILYRTGYVLLHDGVKKEPLWVSYHLTAATLNLPQLPRKDYFAPDPDLLPGERAEKSDYKKSGYDQGHMCPNADQSYSLITMKECFYLSNMCPQIHSLNAGKWKTLEDKIRSFTKKQGEAWIICGPIFKADNAGNIKTIGKNHVWVPTSFYKIVVYKDKQKVEAVGFIMPKENAKGDLLSYVVKIRDIESLTGLDFLNTLPKEEDDRIEMERNINAAFVNN